MANTLIEAKHLSYTTPLGRPLQTNLNFQLQSGQALLITGANGTGKSTLLKLLMHRGKQDSGILKVSTPKSKIEYLPQLENTEVHLPMTLWDVLSISKRESNLREHIEQIALLSEQHLKASWNTASGGERKRTLLTRALLNEPHLLILDEPMNHLDKESRQMVVQVLSRFLKGSSPEAPRAAVMVCHQGLDQGEETFFDLVSVHLDQSHLLEELK